MDVFIKEEPNDNNEVWDDSHDSLQHDINDDNELMDNQTVGQSLSSLSSINPYFNWNPKTHYSVIILNDRLMSETLLSDDDNENDDLNDADVKRRTTQQTSSKRRHNDLLNEDEDDSRDSDSGLATCPVAKSRARRTLGCPQSRVRSHSRGHSLETIQAIRSHSVDEDIDLDLNFSDVTTTTAQTTSATTVVTVASSVVSSPTTSTLAALLNNPCLPPTPPSSHCGSDSENVSFRISEIRRKNAIKGTTGVTSSQTLTSNPSSTLISIQPKNAIHGSAVILTEEEKRTLVAEGYPIPQRFPLTKSEERSLKKIRRKIKNKISAQESRRKKKEYMEELERRVQHLDSRVRELEKENKFLKQNSK